MKMVSIIIPAYNCGKYIFESVQSALKQTYENIEVVVVYDRSDDNTFEVLESFGNSIKLITNVEKTTLGNARNVGMLNSSGEYITFLDGDDIYGPRKVEEEVKELEKSPELGMVYTYVARINENGNILNLKEKTPWYGKMDEYWLRKRFIVISSIMFRRSLLDKIGLMDPSLKSAEDMDFLLRIMRAVPISHIPMYLTFYRIHESQMSRNKQVMDEAFNTVVNRHGLRMMKDPPFKNLFRFIIRFIEKYCLRDHKYYTNEPIRETWLSDGLFKEWVPPEIKRPKFQDFYVKAIFISFIILKLKHFFRMK